MSPRRLTVFFFCKLCGCYIESVSGFVEHKRDCHFEEFQSCKCIVFEERAKSLDLGLGLHFGHGIDRDYQGTSSFSSPPDAVQVPFPASVPVIIDENEEASLDNCSIAVIKNETTSHVIDGSIRSQDAIKVESPKRMTADETIDSETETDPNINHRHTTTDADIDELPPNIFDLDPNSNTSQLFESQRLIHTNSTAAFIKTESFTNLLEPETKLFAYDNHGTNTDQEGYDHEFSSKFEDGGHSTDSTAPDLTICSLEAATKRIVFEKIKAENKRQENQNYRKAISQNVNVQNRLQHPQNPYVLLRRLTVQEINIAKTCSYLVRDRGRGGRDRDRGPTEKSKQNHSSNNDTSRTQSSHSHLIATEKAKEVGSVGTSGKQVSKCDSYPPHPKKLPNLSGLTTRNKVPTRKFMCKQCLCRIIGYHNLKQHLLTHSEERKWKCSVQGCDQTFKFEFNLQTHFLAHSTPIS